VTADCTAYELYGILAIIKPFSVTSWRLAGMHDLILLHKKTRRRRRFSIDLGLMRWSSFPVDLWASEVYKLAG